jgi:hypothetical protein
MSFTERLHARCSAPMAPEEQELCYKAQGKAFASRLGIPTPHTLQGPCALSVLNEPRTHRFAIKPNQGCSGRAIVLAVKEGDTYRSLMAPRESGTHPPRTFRGWIEWCRQEGRRHALPDEWIIEKLAGDGKAIPHVWGIWCVGGTAHIIRQQDLRGRRQGPNTVACTWDRDWNRVKGAIRKTTPRPEDALPKPRNPKAMVEYAERIASAWPGPMVRVDMIEDVSGPLLIECTPRPAGGRIAVNDPWDTMMGEAWAAWESRQTVEV